MLFYDRAHIGTTVKAPLLEGGFLIVWPPGEGQYYGNLKAGYRHTWTHCDGVWIERVLSSSGFPLAEPLRVSDPGMVEAYVAAIYAETVRPVPDPVIVRNLYENWLREVKRDAHAASRRSHVPDWLIDVRNYIEAGYRGRMTLAELALHAHKSAPHLCAEFRKHFGCPPIEYQIRLRLNEAVHLLPDVNLSIGEIAERVGYEDIYHFSKLFKKHHDISPMGMRRRLAARG